MQKELNISAAEDECRNPGNPAALLEGAKNVNEEWDVGETVETKFSAKMDNIHNSNDANEAIKRLMKEFVREENIHNSDVQRDCDQLKRR
jgi:hypothetical protein